MHSRLIFRALFIVANVVTIASAIVAGCGSSDTTTMGAGGHTTSSTGTGVIGWNHDGGNCDKLGAPCMTASDCCTAACTGGVCNLPACTSDNQACAMSSECCSGDCANSACVALNG